MLLDQWTTTTSDSGPMIGDSAPAQESLLEAVMPDPEVRLRQSVTIRRDPAVVFAAAQGVRAGRSPFAALLEAPRPLGSEGGAARAGVAGEGGEIRWVAAMAEPPRRMIAGAAGRLWDDVPGVQAVHDLDDLRRLDAPGACGAVLELRLRPSRGRSTRITAELRVSAGDPATARRLRAHWRRSALGVHIAVRALLSAIRDAAERTED